MKIVIIGGGSAGTTCAFELRKQNKDIEITILEKTSNLEYSPCALPYVLSNEIKSFDDISIFKKQDYENNNIKLLLNSQVSFIDRKNKKIVFSNKDNLKKELIYDKLILATGSKTNILKIKGLDNTNYYVLKTIKDAKLIARNIKRNSKSIILGAGMIGVELAFALSKNQEDISIIESKENILPNMLDNDMSKILRKYLETKNIKVVVNNNIKEIKDGQIILENSQIDFDKLFLCVGVRANTQLAKKIGLKINQGIIVNDFLQTNDKDIYACGDCVESTEFNSNAKILSQLGTIAVRQAKVIVENLLSEKKEFLPVLNNTITNLDGLYVASVGLTQKKANNILNQKIISSRYEGNVKSEYYPCESKINIKIICDENGIIIGAQIIGNEEVVGRINLLALAIQKKLHLKDLINLETCYNPASSPIFDPISITAQICLKKLSFISKKGEANELGK